MRGDRAGKGQDLPVFPSNPLLASPAPRLSSSEGYRNVVLCRMRWTLDIAVPEVLVEILNFVGNQSVLIFSGFSFSILKKS